MMTYRRKRPASVTKSYRPTKRRKAPTRYRGLVPQYTGFVPRAFSQGEWKYKDVYLGASAINDTGQQALLNGLSPGTGPSERIGQKVSVRSIELRAYINATAGTGTDQIHRLQFFMDRQANGAAPTVGQQLATNNVPGLRNLAYRHRFRSLWDRTYNINAVAEPGSFRTVRCYLKFRRPIIVEYNTGVAGTIADIATNSLYLFYIGTNPAGATAGSITGYIRIRYTDI